ncbi:hypothetical protein GCM10027059_24480 [Myceligenerans halotolerans]
MDTPFELFDQAQDPAIAKVAATLRTADPRGKRWSHLIRHTYDVLYNGQETGRYRWDQLMKTEKTHFGTLFEIHAQREFLFNDGDATDFEISGYEVDAKWSQKDGGWMLPPEVFDRIALVATGSDADSVWSLGLIRVTADVRRQKVNRDAKTQLNNLGRSSIHWLWRNEPLRPNALLHLSSAAIEHITDPSASGTERAARLFKATEGTLVTRGVVATVTRQLDAQKRIRHNGGARDLLMADGYLILSGAYHQRHAEELGVPVPLKDEYISVRVTPSASEEGTMIGSRRWRHARPDEKVTATAPRLTR